MKELSPRVTKVGDNQPMQLSVTSHVISLVRLGRPVKNSLQKLCKSVMMCLVIRGKNTL